MSRGCTAVLAGLLLTAAAAVNAAKSLTGYVNP